jgi:hypothetical protein
VPLNILALFLSFSELNIEYVRHLEYVYVNWTLKPWFVKFTTMPLKANKVKCGWQRKGEEYEARFCAAEWRKSVSANCKCVTRFVLKNYFSLWNDLL